ncbi:MAG: 1-deoxy-D-xylulose-5-phosphate reductoisomerase [Bacteroidetes bacterium]|nr:1-deoxy-D-xylulose-5-phosphate reductoisomerase [Bacteroidota bacterium]
MRPLSILGSTGSIGTQALQVVRQLQQADTGKVSIAGLAAGSNAELLIAQAREFCPRVVAVGDAGKYSQVKAALADLPIEVCCGEEGLIHVATLPEVQTVLAAIVGFAGLKPTMAAIEASKDIALANKETLVVAGHLFTDAVRQRGVQLLPVDSEHNAIYQCLVGESLGSVHRLLLTASGGPFRGYTGAQLATVTRAQALRHPNWEMGAKITIDSASLMNKCLEVIEARWLFDIPVDRIDIVVHPQSIVHSLVEFVDGSLKAQLGMPDMRVPIQYALTWPQRVPAPWPRFDFTRYPQLTFETPDAASFRSVGYARHVLEQKGNMPCILNAANEVAVELFLQERIEFTRIYDLIEQAMTHVTHIPEPSLEELLQTDAETRTLLQARAVTS